MWALAARQHGVVTRRQLLDLGFDSKAIDRRLANRRLHVLHRSVYSVGRPTVDRLGELLAAVLACGPYALLSHESAAELWEMLPRARGPIHVSLIASWSRRHPGIEIHRRVALNETDVTTCRAIPVTTPISTVIDLASSQDEATLERAINEADKRDLFDPEALLAAIELIPPRPGLGRVRRVLGKPTFALTDSELERRFLPLVARAGLPTPETQAWVNGFRVDFWWPQLPLIVETDGLRYHRTARQQERDRLRDQAHAAAGTPTLRFTHAQVRYEPDYVVAVLYKVARRLLSSPP